ncbi:MAG: hypothetical protein ACI4TK_08380 [Agathobacter sp.]
MEEKNTYSTLMMKDGKEIKVTLSFYRLYQMRTKWPEQYEKYFKITENDVEDDFDVITMIYIAYLCANIEKEAKDLMSYEEFIINLRFDREDLYRCFKEISVEKKS